MRIAFDDRSTLALRYSRACNRLTGYNDKQIDSAERTGTEYSRGTEYSSGRYSENLSLLLALMRALPVLVWHRQNWNILRPYERTFSVPQLSPFDHCRYTAILYAPHNCTVRLAAVR